MVVKILTWNVNGLRTFKNLNEVIKNLDSDIICIQETKLSRIQVDDTLAFIDGYSSQFAFPRHLTGYSGCATYCRESARPFHAESGINDEFNCTDSWRETLNLVPEFSSSKNLLKELDSEGRCLITCHYIKLPKTIEVAKIELEDTNSNINIKLNGDADSIRKLYIFNVYFPRLDVDKVGRDEFKDRFNKLIELKAHTFLKDPLAHVIIAGDMNISHRKIDHCDPSPDFEECIYKKWLTSFLSPDDNEARRHMVDSFRQMHPNTIEAFTCWNTQIRARATNYGTRIDYLLVDSGLSKYIKDVSILSNVMGSDHCPVSLTLDNVEWIASQEYPPISTKLWPEFGCKKQLTLTSFLVKGLSQITQHSQAITQPTPCLKKPNNSESSQQKIEPLKHSPKKVKLTKNSAKTKVKKNYESSQSSIMSFMKASNKKCEQPLAEETLPVKEESTSSSNSVSSLLQESLESDQTQNSDKNYNQPNISIEKDPKIIDEDSNTIIVNYSDYSNGSSENKVSQESNATQGKQKVSLFEKMMAGPPKPPLCSGHQRPCTLGTVGKPGPNYKRRFWACPLPKGDPTKPNTCCKYFRWLAS